MHSKLSVFVVNTRKVKKLFKESLGLEASSLIAKSYEGKFVVIQCNEQGYVAIQHKPDDEVHHGRTRHIPKQLTTRIRNNNHLGDNE